MSRPGLISVHAGVLKDVLVDRIATGARERAAGDDTPERLGYEMRNVEHELFAPAREPAGWLASALRERIAAGASEPSAIAALSAELADAEPAGKPAPDDESAASWRIPGPGGHVRHFVSLQAAPASKRDFLYGFFRRCCEEALEAERGVTG